MEIDNPTILYGIVLPALLCAVSIVAPMLWRDDRRRWGALPGIAIAAALMVGMALLVESLKILPPVKGYGFHWVFWVAASVAVISAVELALPRQQKLLAVLSVLLTIGAFVRLATVRVTSRVNVWTTQETIGRCGLGIGAVIASVLSAQWISHKRSASAPAAALGVPAMVNPIVLGASGHWASMGFLSFTMAACGGVFTALALALPRLRIGVSGFLALALLSGVMTVITMQRWFSGDLSILDCALIVLAPLGMWAGMLVKNQRLAALLATVAAAAIVAYPLVKAINLFLQPPLI